MKKISITLSFIIMLACMMIFSSCGNNLKTVDFNGKLGVWVFGSKQTGTISITGNLYGYSKRSLENAKEEIITTLREMNEELNTVDKNSLIYEFNNYGINENEEFDSQKKFYISEYLYHMLTVAKELHQSPEGIIEKNGEDFNANKYFNPAIYPLMELWDLDSESLFYGAPRTSVPTTEDIDTVLPYTDFSKVHYGEDENGFYMTKELRQIKLDFGGQAKGYGADITVEICKKYKIKGASFSIGGNAYVFNKKPLTDGTTKMWEIGVNMPIEHKQSAFCALRLENTSLVTSGDYNRFFMFNDIKYAHILDPYTGLPVNIERKTVDEQMVDTNISDGLVSVTIINQNSELSDIYAKIVMLLGMENGIKYLLQNNLNGILISHKQYAAVGEFEQFDINGANGYQDYDAYVYNGVTYSF